MDQLLRPYEYHYLNSPFLCQGEELLEYVLRDLCLRNALQHEDRWVYLTAREPRSLIRTFIQRGPDFDKGPFSLPKQFFLDFFEKKDAFSSSQMVGLIGERLDENPDIFKSDYVYKDLHKKGYCMLFLVNTSEG